MSEEKDIPELTDIAGYAKDINKNEFDFEGLVPGKTLSEADIKHIQIQIDKMIKNKIAIHNKLLYKDLSKNINQLIQNINNDTT